MATTEILKFPLGTTVITTDHPLWSVLPKILGPFHSARISVGRISTDCFSIKVSHTPTHPDPEISVEGDTLFGLKNDELQIGPRQFVFITGFIREESQVLLAFGTERNIMDRLAASRSTRG